ncbi:MAG: hypothetical protein WCA00_17410 [Candidatus Acidiferrales bacterium]
MPLGWSGDDELGEELAEFGEFAGLGDSGLLADLLPQPAAVKKTKAMRDRAMSFLRIFTLLCDVNEVA